MFLRLFLHRFRSGVIAGGLWLALAGGAVWAAEDGTERVVVQLPFTHQFQFAGLYAAQTQGYFRAEGLTVELREGVPGQRPVAEVVAGRAHYGIAGGASLLVDRLKGAPLVALAAIFQHSPLAIMVRADSPIATPLDLVGQRIALDPRSLNAELRAVFLLEGIKPGQYVEVPNLPDRNELLTGEADAIPAWVTDLPFDTERAGVRYRLIRPADYGADFYGDTLFTTEEELRHAPARVEAMHRAIVRGWEYALAHPQELVEWILREHGKTHPNLSRARLRFEAAAIERLAQPDVVAIGHMNPGRWRKLAELVVGLSLVAEAQRVEGFVWNRPQEERVPAWTRWVVIAAGTALAVASLVMLANWRLKRLVDRRTRELQVSEKKQREYFDLAPTPIVVADVQAIADRLEAWRREGVTDLRARLAQEPRQVEELFRLKRVVAANRCALEHSNFGSTEEMDARLREVMTEQALDGFVGELEAIWEGRDALTQEKTYRMLDGRIVHMLLRWSLERVDGRPDYRHVRLVFTDITAIRAAQQALQESEARYRNLFEMTPNPMYIFDTETLRIVMVNEAAVQRYGYTREEFLAMTVLDLRPGEEASRLRESMATYRGQTVQATGAHSAGLWRHRCKDGTILIVEVYTHGLGLNGRPCVLSLPFDMTAKLATEQALRESEARYRELFENAVGGVYRATPDGRFIAVNPAMARLHGFDSPEEMLAWNQRERGGIAYAHAEEHQRFIELLQRQGKVENFESRIIDRHGHTLWISETSRAVHDEQQRLLYYEGFVTDITARRRLEAELMRASKLEAVGILAGGIAHDFNNILTVVLGNVTLAEMDTATDSSVRRMLHDAKRATMRARDLTQQLLTFAKGGDPVRTAVSLPELLRESVEFAMHGSKSRGVFELAEGLWQANADKGQLGQVVQNLAINAVQSMPQGGTVRIRAANARLAAGAVGRLPAGDYVEISVADTGMGIAPDHLTKIFDPYFTTKQQGSGLGLATVYSIVRKHQGHIEVESRLGEGAVFRLWLPAVHQPEPVIPVEAAPLAALRVRVLFMDDEQPIREMARLFMARLGADCVGAPDGQSAVQAYREAMAAGTPFDVVVMDLTVPGGMGGREAMEQLRQIDPQVRAVVSSGYSRDPVLARYREHGFCAVLPKPYGLEQLRKVLDQAAAKTRRAPPA
jgi:PAS domain S-box-containing protein